MNQSFAFTSGNSHHFQGFGEWKVRADESGCLTIQQDLFGVVNNFGVFQLSEVESAVLWDLILGAAFEQRDSSRRPGIPDEAMLGFALSARPTLRNIQLWSGDALADEAIVRLVEQIGALIEKYTGRKPVLG